MFKVPDDMGLGVYGSDPAWKQQPAIGRVASAVVGNRFGGR